MSAVPVGPSPLEVRERAAEIKQKIEAAFPSVDVEIADWDDLKGENSSYWERRGFPLPRPGIHANVLIRGDQAATEEAASLADGEIARLLEETNVVIQVRRTNRVRCKQSVPLVGPSPPALPPFARLLHEEKGGIMFLCSFYEQHDHDFGRLQGKYREAS